VLVNEEHIVLEAGVEVGFKTEVYYHRIVMAVYVGVDTV
jgi:hypothetical protein